MFVQVRTQFVWLSYFQWCSAVQPVHNTWKRLSDFLKPFNRQCYNEHGYTNKALSENIQVRFCILCCISTPLGTRERDFSFTSHHDLVIRSKQCWWWASVVIKAQAHDDAHDFICLSNNNKCVESKHQTFNLALKCSYGQMLGIFSPSLTLVIVVCLLLVVGCKWGCYNCERDCQVSVNINICLFHSSVVLVDHHELTLS